MYLALSQKKAGIHNNYENYCYSDTVILVIK